MKKVLFLMEYPIDLPGGGQMSTMTLCDGLISGVNFASKDYPGMEFAPVVACPKLLGKRPSDYPCRIVEYASDENREDTRLKRIINFFRRIGAFYRIIKEEKPDIIHVSMSESLISFGFLRCLGFFKDIPFVYTDRGLCYGYRKHSKACILMTMKHAEYMICTTVFNEKLWKKEGLSCPIRVIPNTISRSFDDFDPGMRKRQREKYGVKDGELVIGFAGRISEEKDWPFVPMLVRALEDEGINFRLALVISVYEAFDEKQADEIRKGITDSIGEDRLIYMQDLSQDEMAAYYYLVDVFVMSSSFESFGKAAVEAMSRKCSVISTIAGGLPEVVNRDKNLYTKDADGVKRLFAGRIRELFDKPGELADDREYFYKRYKENYTIEANVSRHIDLYREISKGAKA